jgi:hypothetical protein
MLSRGRSMVPLRTDTYLRIEEIHTHTNFNPMNDMFKEKGFQYNLRLTQISNSAEK